MNILESQKNSKIGLDALSYCLSGTGLTIVDKEFVIE